MAPQKMMKNIDVAGEDSNPNEKIMFDTTPQTVDTVKTWTPTFKILEHEIINYPEDSDEQENNSFTTKLRHIA